MTPRALLLVLLASVAIACGDARPGPSAPTPTPTPSAPAAASTAPQGPATWDLESNGVPRFVTHDYIDVARIGAISRFRSAEGHDYWDDVESCRSMKHYFQPRGTGAGTIPVYAPVAGSVIAVVPEWAGVQIVIGANEQPAFWIVLFHVAPDQPLAEGTRLEAGQVLGTHIGDETSSDVAVKVSTSRGMRLVSWFDVITDALFDTYRVRGLTSRADVIISRADRDADPLTCEGGAFVSRGHLTGWVTLW